MRALVLAALLVAPPSHGIDWPGVLERTEMYSALIVGAQTRTTQRALLVASFHDPEISPRAWHGLELDAARNRAPRP